MSAVLQVPPAPAQAAVEHFAARLAFETDCSDVAADLGAGVEGWLLIDTRSQESWDQGHVATQPPGVATASTGSPRSRGWPPRTA